ncbi:MAG: DUF2384 domain-containing protein [Hyphomicrobiales bacterium]|nr:MAG: DUF2384 domain-containing protein [Hyphomicrobiales bacterium]
MNEILELAQELLGSREAAERWLAEPAMALDGLRPLDLMATHEGRERLKALINQLEHGVYV